MIYSQKDIKETIRIWDVEKITEMINNGFPVEKIAISGKTDILLESILRGSTTIFKLALKAGFPILKGQFSYLHYAVIEQDQDFIAELFNYVDNEEELILQKSVLNDFNILHTACENNVSQDIIVFLSQKGANWEEQNCYEQTPLHMLVRNYFYLETDLLEEIIINNVDCDIKDILGISVRDIVESLDFSEEWQNEENNKKLINYIREIENEF